MKWSFSLILVLLMSLSGTLIAQSNSQGSSNGQPFIDLQNQVSILQEQIDTLSAIISQNTIEIDVDCAAGDSVSGAISSVGDALNPLEITIIGTCFESVFIFRDNVTLRGQAPSDGISGNYGVLASRGASHIVVESLTLEGSTAALACVNGANITARNVNLTNSGIGVLALMDGNCEINDSSISENGQGLTIITNGNVWLRGVDVTHSGANSYTTGANIYNNGSLSLTQSTADGSHTLISGFDTGLNVFAGGTVRLTRAIIENNTLAGIDVKSGSSLFVEPISDVYVRNNGTGISIDNLATAHLNNNLQVTDNLLGLECSGSHSIYEFLAPAIIANNTQGDISPSCIFIP
jgi:hypothetical protein